MTSSGKWLGLWTSFIVLLPMSEGLGQTASATYVCVEERSVGWGKSRKNGQEIVGKFQPEERKIIIRWNPEKRSSPNKILEVPYISVAEKGESYLYKSGACDLIYRNAIFTEREPYDSQCQNLLNNMKENREDSYSSGLIHYIFHRSLRYRPPSTQFIEILISISTGNAYLNQGTCAIID